LDTAESTAARQEQSVPGTEFFNPMMARVTTINANSERFVTTVPLLTVAATKIGCALPFAERSRIARSRSLNPEIELFVF
jgi:hypothetical protein